MNLFEILKNLFTNPSASWILDINESDINPVLIQRFLVTNSSSVKQASILNKFAFSIQPKMYLSAAWTLLFFNGKKLHKAPFIQLIKSDNSNLKFHYVLDKIQRQFNMSENDLKNESKTLIKAINKDKYAWFSYYGIKNQYWVMNNMDINVIKTYGNRKKVEHKKGLEAWF